MKSCLISLLLALALTIGIGNAHAEKRPPFYLHNGDRVVFYGDSITEQQRYTAYIETYCVTRFPKMHCTYINSGWGGDRVTGGGGGPIALRVQRDIIAYHPTVVTIDLGMNDGGYQSFNPNLFHTYTKYYHYIIDTLLKKLPGVRITLITASAFDDVTRPANFPGGYNSTLTAFNNEVKRLAAEYHLTLAHTNTALVSLLARAQAADSDQAKQLIPDRVHPSFGGHIIMAEGVLKAWNAPSDVSNVSIDGKAGSVTTSENTRISDVTVDPSGKVSFTEQLESLPWPFYRDASHKNTALVLSVTNVESDLDNFKLQVTNLSAKNYDLMVDGTNMGEVTAESLADGLDLASMPTFPACRQAQTVLGLAYQHIGLHFREWRVVQVPHSKGLDTPPDILKQMDDLNKQEEAVVEKERAATQPPTYHITLVPVS